MHGFLNLQVVRGPSKNFFTGARYFRYIGNRWRGDYIVYDLHAKAAIYYAVPGGTGDTRENPAPRSSVLDLVTFSLGQLEELVQDGSYEEFTP